MMSRKEEKTKKPPRVSLRQGGKQPVLALSAGVSLEQLLYY